MINNSVKDWQGKVIGFRCHQCGNVVGSMWGTTCNQCRRQNENNDKLLSEVKALREQLAKSTTPNPQKT